MEILVRRIGELGDRADHIYATLYLMHLLGMMPSQSYLTYRQ
jgi:hypothetical protein